MAPQDSTSDEEWPDPSPGWFPEIDRQELGFRLLCSFGVLLVLIVLTRGILAESIALFWPPTEPLGQWTMFILLNLFGYIILPLMVGSMIADILQPRLFEIEHDSE